MRTTFVLLLAAAGLLAAAEPSYFGEWKFNPDKSDFGESTVTFAQTASGATEYTADARSYTFKLDGVDYPTPWGETAAWKQVDATTWGTTHKLNGKLISADTVKLSADGQALTIESKGTKPAGGTFVNTIVYRRVSGTAGLAGKWQTKKFRSSSPDLMELSPAKPDGLRWSNPAFGMTAEAQFDGTDCPVAGPTLGAGWTMAVQRAGPRAFEMTVKQNGILLYRETYTVSADGKVLIEAGSPAGVNEKYKVVYDRQ